MPAIWKHLLQHTQKLVIVIPQKVVVVKGVKKTVVIMVIRIEPY